MLIIERKKSLNKEGYKLVANEKMGEKNGGKKEPHK